MHLNLDTYMYFNSSPIYHLYVLLVEISYQARFCLQILYPEILFTMLKGFWNHGSFIVHVHLLGTRKSFTLSVFLPGTRVHVVLPGTRQYMKSVSIQIMHIRKVVSKNYSPRGNFIKVWNTRGWKPSVFWIFIKLPRVDNFTNDRSPNVHYWFYKMIVKN